jgi:hypothetical protein
MLFHLFVLKIVLVKFMLFNLNTLQLMATENTHQ